ncbi:MAG: hypothetical protein OXH01_06755 [Bacteroidetes bacterium]|nr:hypothetical protein [Bacteroidota bacterium]
MQVRNLIAVSDRLDSDPTVQVRGMFRDSQELKRPLSELSRQYLPSQQQRHGIAGSRQSMGSRASNETGRNP